MAAAIKVVGGLLLAVVAGWLGYQVYLHLTDARAAGDRIEAVSRVWEDDPASLAAAAGGSRVTPPALADRPFQQLGAVMAESASAEGTRLTLRVVTSSCGAPAYTADVKATAETVTVLVRPQGTWLPDLGNAWRQLRGEVVACDAVGVPLDVEADLGAPLGDRLVIDAVSGSSVPAGPQAAD